jgi:prolipoprotein diacylglyceryl transferase
MLPVIQIGPLALQTPGIIWLSGLWLGSVLAEKHSHRFGIDAKFLSNLVILGLLSGVIGARIAYLFRYPQAFLADIKGIISLNPGLLDFYGGLLVALLVGAIYLQRKKVPYWSALDALTPLLMVLMIAGSLASLANGTGYGSPTGLPWAIHLWEAQRHPSQVYALIASLVVLISLYPTRRFVKKLSGGMYFLSFASATAFWAIFLESFRGDSILLPGGFRANQVYALVILSLSLILLSIKLYNQRNVGSLTG